MSRIEFDLDIKDVQNLWNEIENKLVEVADLVAPLRITTGNNTKESLNIPPIIKRKMNQRKKLIARLRLNPDPNLKQRLGNLNVEIKNHFYIEINTI